MREEKIFDVNWEGERNISENPQAFKMYSYPPGTIRNMSVPGFIIWLDPSEGSYMEHGCG